MKNKKNDIESLERKSIHKVPERYFDELPLNIQTRINEQNERSSPAFIPRMRLAWSMTAAVAIFFIGWFLYPQDAGMPTSEELLADITSEDLISYLYEEDVSTEEILASIDENYLLEELDIWESDMLDEELSEEDLESIYSELDYSTEIM